MDISEADRVVDFEFIFGQIGPLRQRRKELHADRLCLIMLLRLPVFILLHFHEVFPLALTHLVSYHTFLFLEEAGTHEFAPLRRGGKVD